MSKANGQSIGWRLLISMGLALMQGMPALAAEQDAIAPLVVEQGVDTVYPRVAGRFLVYSQVRDRRYSVTQVTVDDPARVLRRVVPTYLREAVRFGVALADGRIGFVSNRMGPVSAWMRLPDSATDELLSSMGTYSGAVVPRNLNASPDGRIWCFDTSLEKVLQSRAITQFGDPAKHRELLGQTWRFYSSDAFEPKMGYRATKTGNPSKFQRPVLFVLDRVRHRVLMIRNAMQGAISPDDRHVVFVRETNGNYDLWMQDLDGHGLTQLTDSPYGDFEPAWSPKGDRIAFVSNRASHGEVLETSIYVLDLASGALRRVTHGRRFTDGAPAWLNAHTLAFHSNRDPRRPLSHAGSHWHLWKVDIGGNQ